MQTVGFVLFVIGIGLVLGAKRIVQGKLQVDDKDKQEMEMLTSGGVIAVKVAGLIVTLIGFLFLMM